MFDLKFDSSALDKMPVGTSFRDSDHEIVKTDGGWKCEDCDIANLHDSSSAYIGTTYRECALDKFAGAVIDPDDLDPRLLAFLPVGTRVADNDTLSNDRWHWHKTKSGRWIWTENYEKAESLSNNKEMGYEDLRIYENLRPFRLFSVGTDEAPESVKVGEEFKAAVATKLTDYALKDSDGDIWRFNKIRRCWEMTWANGSPSGILNGTLSGGHEPYTVYEEADSEPEKIPEGKTVFSAAEATDFKDCRFRDRDGDVWLFDEETERWRFIHFDGSLSRLSQYEKLSSAMEPFVLVEGEPKTEPETEPETGTGVDPAEELSAEQADEKRDFVLSDSDGDAWTYSDGKWRCEGYENLSCHHLSDLHEPYEIVEPSEAPEPEPEPAEKTELSAKEASEQKDTVFEDGDGDAWFFDDVLQRWRGIRPDWAYSKEELEPLFSPYTKVGPLSEFERPWTAEEANDLKDETLEDRDGDTWIYDVPSEKWKCVSAAIADPELIAFYQPYRIKKAEQARDAAAAGFEAVTFEGSAKEAVELLDRIARSLESIDRKLGDK